jgi:hypothetical protein
MNKTQEMIDLLNKWDENSINAVVILHFDKETKLLKSISPMLQASSMEELYNQLSSAEKAIHAFLNDLINKGLHKN